jgi:hypothetical protein
MSIIFFYIRVFPAVILQKLSYILYVSLAVVVAWGISFAVAIILQCRPINYGWDNWDKPPAGHCVNFTAMAWAHGGINLVFDIWLLVLPMPTLWKLRMPLLKKLGVCTMFAVGLL